MTYGGFVRVLDMYNWVFRLLVFIKNHKLKVSGKKKKKLSPNFELDVENLLQAGLTTKHK